MQYYYVSNVLYVLCMCIYVFFCLRAKNTVNLSVSVIRFL